MLFLGTQKYPLEEEYEQFLRQYGGFANAWTDMEDTSYFFSVTTEKIDGDDSDDDDSDNNHNKASPALHGALDRLAQFFISPLFNQDSVDREVKAIDSEYRNGKTSGTCVSLVRGAFYLLDDTKQYTEDSHNTIRLSCCFYRWLAQLSIFKEHIASRSSLRQVWLWQSRNIIITGNRNTIRRITQLLEEALSNEQLALERGGTCLA